MKHTRVFKSGVVPGQDFNHADLQFHVPKLAHRIPVKCRSRASLSDYRLPEPYHAEPERRFSTQKRPKPCA